MATSRLQELFERFIGEQMTPEELHELQEFIRDETHTKELDKLLQDAYANNSLAVTSDYNPEEVFSELMNKMRSTETPVISLKRHSHWRRIAVAAAILIAMGTGGYFLFFNKTGKPVEVREATISGDVKAPETNRAMITMADGKKVYLDSASNGTLITQGNINLVKLANGQIQYNKVSEAPSPLERAGGEAFNTLTNPRGSKVIDMTLADGSHVWLNAGSSITYPVAFVDNERKVSITGEAYFEVSHDANKPFYVTKGDVEVKVLGTHFNVNAYDDETDTRVTLLEGSVKVSNGNTNSMLRPGEQARVSNGIKVVSTVDMDEVMAWKNGLFKYNGTDIQILMRQAARWYDVEVVYAGKIPDDTFSGAMQRTVSLATWLKVLEESGVKFRIEGKKVTVLP